MVSMLENYCISAAEGGGLCAKAASDRPDERFEWVYERMGCCAAVS